MTDLSEKIIEAGARASAERDGWDFDNMPGRARAQYLGASKTALLAVLQMVAEEIAALVDDRSIPVVRASFSSLIEDLK